jgi:putative ABC transport system substrate-binding protein
MPVVGFLNGTSPEPAAPFVTAFRQGLSEAGYVEGRNVVIEYRWAEYHYDQLAALAADFVAHQVDVIAAYGGAGEALAAKTATSTIPVVFTTGADPVERDLVTSFARPGGNLTGIAILNVEIMQKRLELISELVPGADVIGLLVNPNNPGFERIVALVREAARTKGVELQILKAGTDSEIEAAFESLVQLRVGALFVADPLFNSRREELVGLAARHAIPTMYEWREFAAGGGLISYGTRLTGTYRQAGAYVGRVLAGAKPADLPVQQPTKFELCEPQNRARAWPDDPALDPRSRRRGH